MRAVVVQAYGVDHTSVQQVAEPPLAEGAVRIAVEAAGVSFANLLAIDGKHQNRKVPPFIPGTEVAGTIVECGPGVMPFRPGQRVTAAVTAGGFAEQVVAPVSTTFALPDAVDFLSALHFPTIYATAYLALVWKAQLQVGETLLVHGAAGGSGLAAIEIGKRLGARVIATVGGPQKAEAAKAHGADLVIDYRQTPFREAVLDATNGRGADVIFDPVGGSTFDESLRCVAPDGRLIPMGFAGGQIPQIPANLVLVKNVTVIGLYLGYYMGWARQLPPPGTDERLREAFEQMFAWTLEGSVKPQTSKVFPLESFREALAELSNRAVIGRVALAVTK